MKFSVIIPAYRSRYLKMAIESVLSQTYENYEIIVVDDCSPENISSIVSEFSDSRIRYYRNEKNYGAQNLVDNWNSCLAYCTGDYMICMGDDDILPSHCLEEYRKVIDKYPDVNVIHGWTNIIDSDSNVVDILQQHPAHESVFGFMLRSWKGDDIFAGNILYKVKALREKGGFVKMPMAWHSDHLTAFLCAGSQGIAATSKLAFSYRRHSRTISMSSSSMKQKLQADFETLKWMRSFFDAATVATEEERMQLSAAVAFLPHIFELSLTRTISECNRRKPLHAIAAFMKLPKDVRHIKLLIRIIINVFA